MRSSVIAVSVVVTLAGCGARATPGKPVPRAIPAASTHAAISPQLAPQLDSIMSAAMADSITPGGAIAVGRHGQIVLMRAYGHTDFAADAPSVTDSTLYDLASLTKVVATTTAAMILEEDSLLDLDRPVVSYLPEFAAPDKAGVTSRLLLLHRSGIHQSGALRNAHGLSEFIAGIDSIPLAWPPGEHTEYSDWNMVVLQAVIERIAGMPLDEFTRTRVFEPLRMRDTGYNPLAGLRARAAPTHARGGVVQGVVHDPTAFALGGVSGNAGLFSSARDLAVFAQMLLNGGASADVRILHPATVARWTARQQRAASRALGWDTPADSASAGHYMSPWSFGHTGFTGTSIWVDVNADMFVVVLTNYSRPQSNSPRIRGLRWAIDNAVRAAVTDMPLRNWESDAREPVQRPIR